MLRKHENNRIPRTFKRDIGIERIDGTINKWLERINKIKNTNTQTAVIRGATHSFSGHKKELAEAISSFMIV